MSCVICKKPFTLDEPGFVLVVKGKTVRLCARHWNMARFAASAAGRAARVWFTRKYPKLAELVEQIGGQLRQSHGAQDNR